MKNLKSNISYKLYPNGEQFIKENEIYLRTNKHTYIETAFFFLNAQNYRTLNQRNYALQIKNNEEVLLILKLEPYNMLIYGSESLCEYAANIIADLNLVVENVLGEEACTLEFLKCYQNRLSGELILQHSMQIMVLDNLKYFSKATVFQCTAKDLEKLALCYCCFYKEALSEEMELSKARELLKGKENAFYAIKEKDKIVSIATKTRYFEDTCSISHVFTIPEYRGRGYAREVVAKLCEDIIKEGKTPNLYVDSTNPISNHLYLSLGFNYLMNQVQYQYRPARVQTAIFAGGCFWCMAEPFYSLDGVKRVVSGFVGGEEVLPTYGDVKYGNTKHREAILIEYDASKIKYTDLLEIYFSSIDPFDFGGQYIDRGHNYTCGIYTSSLFEKEEVSKHIKELEESHNQKVCVELCDDTLFYPAEEEHQDFALKNPEKMQEELKISGRQKQGEKKNG